MNAVWQTLDRVIAGLVVVGELIVALMCLHIVAEITANALFRSPIEGTPEIVARWYMAAIVFLPLALIQRHDRHIKAELLTRLLGPRADAMRLLLFRLTMTAIAFLLAWYTAGDAIDRTIQGERIELVAGAVPTWPTRWFVPIGFATMGLVALLTAIAELGKRRGDKPSERVSKPT